MGFLHIPYLRHTLSRRPVNFLEPDKRGYVTLTPKMGLVAKKFVVELLC